MGNKLDIHAVIMAGGGGKRFWPLSRNTLPKQFLRLVDNKSMISHTAERLLGAVAPENIWVITNKMYLENVQKELPYIPQSNIIAEPMRRDTAGAVLLATSVLSSIAAKTMVLLPADHVILPQEAFSKTIETAHKFLQKSDDLFVFGVPPKTPSTNFGYIRQAQHTETLDYLDIFSVDKFVEKPDAETAKQYLKEGNYYWNSGIFAWNVSAIVENFQRFLPEHFTVLEDLKNAWGTAQWDNVLQQSFAKIPSISVDYGIMEKAKNVSMLKTNFYWNDVGTWDALEQVATEEDRENTIVGNHIGIDTQGCIIHSEKQLVATIGIQDLVVATTDDAVLVVPKHLSRQVKDIVDLLATKNMEKYL